ncbi:MAG: carboxypeptidase regulatory-like domain-containing protein [Acidobacteriota bacterium]|nr:carboxypeptidase regulatory-like domain-containing protein [Acidobacteriota bacterium]
MTRADGTYNDGYADNVSFSLIRAAEVPANLAAWHGGDGDARNFTGVSDGTLVNNPGFVVGKVGQAFRFQNGSHVEINSNGIFRGQTEGTIEAWIRPRGFAVGTYRNSAIWVESEASRNFTRFGLFYSDTGLLGVYSNNSTVNAVSPAPLALNEWAHVAGTYRAGEGVKLYVNGVLTAASSNSGGALTNDLGAFIGIGALLTAAGDDFRFNGDIDEPSVYTRALSPSEIQSIYNAGTAGKELRVTTGTGVSSVLRDATVTFTDVTTAGETSQTPLDFLTLPALPYGFMHAGLAYDISTTAVFTGDVNLCFNLPALANANFSRLRILHLENGVWVNRTTGVNSPQLCGRVSSLSPFVIAENLAPTSASVAVGGRVTTNGGRGISGAQIALTDQSGAKRYAQTNQFGYYRFDTVAAGATYILTAHGKNYVFEPRTRVLLVNEELTDVDFTAQANQESLYRGAAAAAR